MTCDEARLLIGADPGASVPGLEEHLRECPACSQWRAEMRALDTNIRRALEQPPQLAAARRRAAVRRQWPLRQLALAASVLLAFVVLAAWLLRPTDSLAHDVVAHVQGEPESWLAGQQVSAEGIAAALRSADVALDLTSDQITYAHSCWFRGHYVPHLVLQTASGPATVLILRHEQVASRSSFHEDGMSGVIVPAGRGSIAVLAHGSGGLDALAARMQQDVRWLPGG